MARGMADSHGVLWRLGRAALGFAVFGIVVTLPGVAGAGAGDGLLTYASFSGFEFGEQALSDQELGQQRGAGLDDQGTASSGVGDSLAVILWDELKRNGNGGISATSYDNGVDSGVSSTITGQAY